MNEIPGMGSPQKGFSVIICCYNAVTRLKPTLEHIAGLKVPDGWAAELIIVDNNSSDDTTAYARKVCRNYKILVLLQSASTRNQRQG